MVHYADWLVSLTISPSIFPFSRFPPSTEKKNTTPFAGRPSKPPCSPFRKFLKPQARISEKALQEP
ncbi:hypothetical protein F5Y06DRAFT_137904 [Hypoxylon sp. FL0890]|nr:hypothetical protein F5Y06DRAFT_137904 [Hypoxylon sp. FL0890]